MRTPSCQFATVPNDTQDFDAATLSPAPRRSRTSPTSSASSRRRSLPRIGRAEPNRSREAAACSTSTGCALCHTPTLRTGKLDGRGAAESGRQPLLRPVGARHGRRTGRRRLAGPGGPEGVPHRPACGAWGSGSSSCMTAGPRTSWRRFSSIAATARKRTGSSRNSTTCGRARSRTFSTSCVRCSRRFARARRHSPNGLCRPCVPWRLETVRISTGYQRVSWNGRT